MVTFRARTLLRPIIDQLMRIVELLMVDIAAPQSIASKFSNQHSTNQH
jgi:hypothetical protein